MFVICSFRAFFCGLPSKKVSHSFGLFLQMIDNKITPERANWIRVKFTSDWITGEINILYQLYGNYPRGCRSGFFNFFLLSLSTFGGRHCQIIYRSDTWGQEINTSWRSFDLFSGQNSPGNKDWNPVSCFGVVETVAGDQSSYSTSGSFHLTRTFAWMIPSLRFFPITAFGWGIWYI